MKKRLAAAFMAVMVMGTAAAINATTVQAASSVSDTIDNNRVTATVSMGSSYATATTQWAHTGGGRYAHVKYYYKFGKQQCYSVNAMSDTLNTAGATATSKLAGSVSYGARGTHSVDYGARTWSAVTTVGTVPNSDYDWVVLY